MTPTASFLLIWELICVLLTVFNCFFTLKRLCRLLPLIIKLPRLQMNLLTLKQEERGQGTTLKEWHGLRTQHKLKRGPRCWTGQLPRDPEPQRTFTKASASEMTHHRRQTALQGRPSKTKKWMVVQFLKYLPFPQIVGIIPSHSLAYEITQPVKADHTTFWAWPHLCDGTCR